MKLSTMYVVGLTSAADEPPRGHLKRLQGLVRGTTEILNSGAFNRKPKSWIKMWEQKIVTNADRMERSYNRGNQRCGEEDRKRRDIDIGDRYDRQDPCRGVKQLTTGFANWVERYIPNCSGQRDHSHQINRMKKWGERLQSVMQCDKLPKCLDVYPLPEGYQIDETDFGHVYYKIHDGTHTIAKARNLCKKDASFLTLPMPRNEEQNDYYFNLVGGGPQTSDMWLDFSDEVDEGIWLDAYGEPVTWFKWGHSEPNNANSGGKAGQGEHWVEMDLSGYDFSSSQSNLKKWNDIWFSTTLNGGFDCSGGRNRRNGERLDCRNDNIAVCTFVVPKNSDICKF